MTYGEKKIVDKVYEDLKWWLDNTEKGVVYIPEFILKRDIEELKSLLEAREE